VTEHRLGSVENRHASVDSGESSEPALTTAPVTARAGSGNQQEPGSQQTPETQQKQSRSKSRKNAFASPLTASPEPTMAPPITKRRWRRSWRSPLTRRILALNTLVLLIPVFGLLHLTQYRSSLIGSELDSLRIQARAFSLSLANGAVVTAQVGEEQLVPDKARSLMRVLLAETGVRARLFEDAGEILADSYVLSGPGGQVQMIELPPPEGGMAMGWLGRHLDRMVNWLPGQDNLELYTEDSHQNSSDYSEVMQALQGNSTGMVRQDRSGHLVLTLAVPVQRYRRILGALMLSTGGSNIEAAVRDRRIDILMVCGVALGMTILISLYLAGIIARPLVRLAEAADRVRYGKGRQYEIPDFTHRRDEIGELSGALRDMTEALWNRLDAIEGFAADVAHEIKNPLTSLRSAVETVARIEDPSQQKRLMAIILDDVQRLDRLISDISDASRLDAELSRANTESVDIGRLLDALVEVHRATAAENGPRFEVEVADNQPLIVQGIEGRLGQVLRNLISNAITFSPPEGLIRLHAERIGSDIVLTISDDGPGIPDGKLEAIFNRFYTERPKSEKFGTHSGLGLSISKQIVEAHGGTIVAQNRYNGSAEVAGTRFKITLPAE
jgi:two-component system sensor histidine kinase ChvG